MSTRRSRPQLEFLEPRTLLSAGGLDTSFGTSGLVNTPLTSSGGDTPYALVIQSDGEIVVGGDAGGQTAMGLARYTSSGSLDSSFGSGGIVVSKLGTGVRSLALQTDGKLVVGGFGSGGLVLARFTTSGQPDKTFGSGGKVSKVVPANAAWGVAIQSDGKIVTVGQANSATSTDFDISRFNPNGSLDKSFGGTGNVTTDINGYFDSAQAVAVQPGDGKILVVGFTDPGIHFNGTTDGQFVVVRYNTDGSLDPSFGTGGKVVTNLSQNPVVPPGVTVDAQALSTIIQPDGKIVAVGQVSWGGVYQFALARYNADGSLDTTFGSGGESILVATAGAYARGSALEQNGEIVVSGRIRNAPYGNELALYNTDGSLDSSFGSSGVVTTPTPNGSWGGASTVAIQPADQKIVTAGPLGNGSGSNTTFFLARYLGNSSTPSCSPVQSPPADAGTDAQTSELVAGAIGTPDFWSGRQPRKLSRPS